MRLGFELASQRIHIGLLPTVFGKGTKFKDCNAEVQRQSWPSQVARC